MKAIKKEKLFAAIMTTLLFASVIAALIIFKENLSLKTNLNDSRLQNESLLSEKLLLDKEIAKFKAELTSLQGKNKETDKLLAETRKKLADRENAYAALSKENANSKNLKKQLAEISDMKAELQRQVELLNAQNNSLMAENKNLQNSLLAMQDKNDELQKLIRQERERPDNYMVESYKNEKKGKMTLNAKKTKKIVVLFDVPQDAIAGISFNITTPEGNVISDKDKSLLTWEVVSNENQNLRASLNSNGDILEVSTQVKVTYTPKSKLSSGEYKIGITRNNKSVGTCRVRLI